MKLKPERIPAFINFWINFVMGAILSFYVLSKNGMLTTSAFFHNWVLSFGIGYTVGDLLPAPVWGAKLAKMFNLKGNTFMHHAVSTLVLAVCMITCISFICTWLNAPAEYVMSSWLAVYPFLVGCGFVVQLILLPPLTKAALKLAGLS